MGAADAAQSTQMVPAAHSGHTTQMTIAAGASAPRSANDAAGPDTRRRRRLRAVLPEHRPPFIAPREWAAVTLWVCERWPLERVAAEVGIGRWPLIRAINRTLGALERAGGSHPRLGRDEFAALPLRQAHRLRQAGVHSPRVVAMAPDAQLLAINGIGPVALRRLRSVTVAECAGQSA